MMRDAGFLIIYLVLELLNYLLAYILFLGVDVTKKQRRWAVTIILLLLIHLIFLMCSDLELAKNISILTMLLVPILLLTEKKKQNFFIYPFIVIGISTLTICNSFILALIVRKIEYDLLGNPEIEIICQSIPVMIMLAFFIWQKLKNHEKIYIQLELQQYVFLYLSLICILLMLGSLQQLSSGDLSQWTINMCGLTISVSCVFFVILVIALGIIQYRDSKLKEQNYIQTQYMETQEKYFQQLIEQDDKLRRFRHDINAHMAALDKYREEDGKEEYAEYVDTIMEESGLFSVEQYTGNKGVDAVVQQLVDKAEQKKIQIKFGGIIPAQLKVSVYDLCTIMSNLINNAIEAVEKIPDASERVIEVQLNTYEALFIISIRNRVLQKVQIEKNEIITTKKDHRNHGLGLGNIKLAVSRYNGEVQYSCTDQWFQVEIILSI